MGTTVATTSSNPLSHPAVDEDGSGTTSAQRNVDTPHFLHPNDSAGTRSDHDIQDVAGTSASQLHRSETQLGQFQPFQLEPDQSTPHTLSFPERLNRRIRGLGNSIRDTVATIWSGTGTFCLVVLLGIVCLLPDGLFVLYAYYFSYAEIYFNSKVAIHIYQNDHTEGAFKFFYWFLALICTLPNGLAGFGIAWVGWKIGKGANMPRCLFYIWMIPWALSGLATKSVTFWIRPVVTAPWQTNVWNNGCNGWELAAALGSSSTTTLPQTLPIVGNANLTFTSVSGANYTAELSRHADDHLRFDFQVRSASGDSVGPAFLNITYDYQNNAYIATDSTFKSINGSYLTSPNLAFPELNLTLLDDSIPFQRPDYSSCWPAAASLVFRNSTSSNNVNVLRTLTLDPNDRTRLMVCGSAGLLASQFQIALGVIFIDHYYYSLCSTKAGVQLPMGTTSDPDQGDSQSDW
jgi:hypothetical protein